MTTVISDIHKELDSLVIEDWLDVEDVKKKLAPIFSRIMELPTILSDLIDHTLKSPDLLEMCEEDQIRTKLVLYESPRNGIRLRLHFWKEDIVDLIHSHRFTYCARILHGGYQHTLYNPGGAFIFDGLERIPEIEFAEDHELVASNVDLEKIEKVASFNINAGQIYCQNPSILSSTQTSANTVSLFIRGPALHKFAFQWDHEAKTVIWRRGQAMLTNEEKRKVSATPESLAKTVNKLKNLSLLDSRDV